MSVSCEMCPFFLKTNLHSDDLIARYSFFDAEKNGGCLRSLHGTVGVSALLDLNV